MNNLDEIVKKIGPSLFIPGVSLATLPKRYRRAAERAQEQAAAVVRLEQRLASDRELYGVSEAEQVRLIRLGLYEAAIGLMTTDKAKDLKDSMTGF